MISYDNKMTMHKFSDFLFKPTKSSMQLIGLNIRYVIVMYGYFTFCS